MPRVLGLHHMNAMDLDPIAFVRTAAEAGAERVSLFTCSPAFIIPAVGVPIQFPAVTRETRRGMQDALAETGIGLRGIEFFPIVPGQPVEQFRDGLALGAELGGVRSVCHIHDTDHSRALDSFGQLCDLAAAEGLAVAIEFTPMSPGCPDIGTAKWFVDQAGRDNAGIDVDFLHVVRSGGTAAELAALEPHYFTYAQICDGRGLHVSSDYLTESSDRLMPGAGDFPVAALLDAMPAEVELEVEVPSASRIAAGLPPLAHMREALERSQRLVDAASPRGVAR